MSGVETFGLVLGCTGLAFSLIPSVLDYRTLPDHASELQDFVKRQQHYLATIEADFKFLLDWEMLCPGTFLRQAQMTNEDVESLQNFLLRYRKCLDEFNLMLSGICRTTGGNIGKAKSGLFDLKRLRMVIGGKTGMGIGTLQAKQNFLQMYMLEARTHRRRLENTRKKPLPSRLINIRMGQTAAAAYKVSHLQQTPSYPQQQYNAPDSDYYNDLHRPAYNHDSHSRPCCHHPTPRPPAPLRSASTPTSRTPEFHAPWPVHPIAASTYNFDKPRAPGYEINRSDSVSPTDTLVGSINIDFNDFGQDIERKQMKKVHDIGAASRDDDAELRFQRKKMAGIPSGGY